MMMISITICFEVCCVSNLCVVHPLLNVFFLNFLNMSVVCIFLNLTDLVWCRKLDAHAVAWRLACIDAQSFLLEWLIAL